MKPSVHSPWNRLIAAARRAPAEGVAVALETPSPGFATRVIALSGLRPGSSSTSAIFERLALRALACAVAVMLASAAWNLTSTATAASASNDDHSMDLIDPVGEVLQIVQVS